MSSSGERGEGWFTSLYAAHYPDIVRYGIRRVDGIEAASELAQDVFVIAWRRRDQVPDRGLPWLYGVARRLLANQWRARRAAPATLPITDAHLLPARAEFPSAVEQPRGTSGPPVRGAVGSRRWVMVAAAATITAVGAAAIYPHPEAHPRRPGSGHLRSPGNASSPGNAIGQHLDAVGGTVLVPIAYQAQLKPEAAGPQLRRLAARLAPTAYDSREGRYAFHHTLSWGDLVQGSPEGYEMSYVFESKTWLRPDGSGRKRTWQRAPEYPDEASRRYWESVLPPVDATPTAEPGRTPPPPGQPGAAQEVPGSVNRPPLPDDRAGLRETLAVRHGAGSVAKKVMDTYYRYVVNRRTRGEILRVLAEVPGFVWRGTVTDRAGRGGVAITFTDNRHDQEHMLIFHPRSGELLAHELIQTAPGRHVGAYTLLLASDRTPQPG